MKTLRNKKSRQNKTKKTFKKKDFNAPDGFLTSIWGPALWHALHTISFNYPTNPTDSDKKNYREFMLSLVNVLPCKYCRENLINNYKEYPLTMECMENRNKFSRYVYKLHETVNKLLGKKSGLSYCDVRERYEHFRARCTEENPKLFNFKKTRKNKREKGCTEPLYGKKAKCVIKIVPNEEKCKTFQMDKKCKKTRE
jgi:hypothetical protein|tara:strand:+ start:718 stop:1308 length:591 start_codon:yes stop_codon:yes gene_type:complete